MDTYTLIYADDSLMQRELFRKAVSAMTEYTVLCVPDGVECIEAARLYHPSAVLIDRFLGNDETPGVITSLKSDPDTESIPVFLLSAEHGQQDLAHRLGADEFIEKVPIDQMLVDVIAAIDRHQ